MRLDMDGSSVVRRPAIRRHIERAVSRGLGPFMARIGTVRIRLCERAPSEATRALCGIAVTLEPRDEPASGWVLSRAEDDDACRAVERLAKTLDEQIARHDREAAAPASALALFSQRGIVERV